MRHVLLENELCVYVFVCMSCVYMREVFTGAGEREREREREIEIEGEIERDNARERECVCVYLCV